MLLEEVPRIKKISPVHLIGLLSFVFICTLSVYSQENEELKMFPPEVIDTTIDSSTIKLLSDMESGFEYKEESETSEDTEGVNDSTSQENQTTDKTCSELYSDLKKSNCGKTFFKYLNGASVKIGATLNLSSIQVKSNDSLYGDLVGILSPAPYYSLSLAAQYISNWNVGYQFALAYTSTSAVKQRIERGDTKKVVDLNTLSILGLAAVTPSIFYSIGGRDEDPNIYTNFGFGLGIGWAWVKGVVYHTEQNDTANQTCYDAATDYTEGTVSKSSIIDNCELKNFQQAALGLSARLFLEGRWNFVFGGVEVVGITIQHSGLNFHPTEAKLKLAYILDI